MDMRRIVKSLKEMYPVGTRVELVKMDMFRHHPLEQKAR